MKVFIADSSHSTRNEIGQLLAQMPGVNPEVVGQAEDAPEALEKILCLTPDVVMLDVQLHKGCGIQILESVKKANPDINFIMLTNAPTLQQRVRCMALGADYLVDKDKELRKIITAVYSLSKNIGASQMTTVKPTADERQYFAWMDERPEILLFADHTFRLRHANPAAHIAFAGMEQFLPDKLENLVGGSLGLFHRQPEIVRKIIENPQNLPYQAQIVYGPKSFNIETRSVYSRTNVCFLGVVVLWQEIIEQEGIY